LLIFWGATIEPRQMIQGELRLKRELVHYKRIRSFFDDTVARIILEEMAAGKDRELFTTLEQEDCRSLEQESRKCEVILNSCRRILNTDIPAILMKGPAEKGMARVLPSPSRETANYIVLSPEALEMPEGPLSFVLGHEMAHLAFSHHVLRWIIDTVFPPEQAMPPYLANEFAIWQQYAELSADRAGLAICGSITDMKTVIRRLNKEGLPSPEDRLACLTDPQAESRVYNAMLRIPEDGFQLALVRLLRVFGEILIRSDGKSGESEKAYLINRISRHSYIDPEETGNGQWFPEEENTEVGMKAAGKEIRERFPDRREEAFLNLAIIIVRDGRVTENEYLQLSQIATTHLGLDESTVHRLLLRVFRSGYYSPFEE